MSQGSQFSLAHLGRKFIPELSELQVLVEYLPHAALLIDSHSLKILSANSRALDLTAYTQKELQNLSLEDLLIDLGDKTKGTNFQGKSNFKIPYGENLGFKLLVTGNNAKLDVLTSQIPLPPKNKRSLVVIQAANTTSVWSDPIQANNDFWLPIINLLNITPTADSCEAINQALQIGQSLTKVGILSVYLASDNNPGLHRWAGVGNFQLLPEKLSAHELVLPRSIQFWTAGQRPTNNLQKSAHSKHFMYMVTAPLGEPRASVGLLVIADTQKTQHPNIHQLVELLATKITSILQEQSYRSQMEFKLKDQNRSISVSKMVEESVHEGIILLNPDLTIIRLNSSAEMILGYATKEVVGQPSEKILIGTETLIPALLAAQQGDATYSLGNLRLYRRRGDDFLAHVHTLPIKVGTELEGIVVLLEDLSEEEQIREQTQQLEQRALLGEVTAIFAHEVRNPINNISTGLELLSFNLPNDDPNQNVINRLQQDCERLEELMKSVLSFARPTDYDMEPVDIRLILKRLLERMHPRLTRVNVNYQFQPAPDVPPVQGNPRALEQVFSNLVNNAAQAMNETGGHLVIKTQLNSNSTGLDEVEISVADTGPGIPKEHQEKIFQPFYTTNRNGTGLGLAICKRIVTLHKGSIWVTSFPGGTVFHVRLPVATQSPSVQ